VNLKNSKNANIRDIRQAINNALKEKFNDEQLTFNDLNDIIDFDESTKNLLQRRHNNRVENELEALLEASPWYMDSRLLDDSTYTYKNPSRKSLERQKRFTGRYGKGLSQNIINIANKYASYGGKTHAAKTAQRLLRRARTIQARI
jgi:hypothetical protein